MKKSVSNFWTILLVFCMILTLAPIFIILMNSFKGQFFIADSPFALPNSETFVGLKNYVSGLEKTGFLKAFGYSLWITVASVLVIILFTSMTAWYITRVKTRLTGFLYYFFIFSMIVPFQMVMFTMAFVANRLKLDNPFGIILIYLGFGSGLAIFMFCGFIKSIPLEIEEAAMIDGCSPVQIFFSVVFPILRPTAITVAILNAMWIWNDYLLPLLLLTQGGRVQTLPLAVQVFIGSYLTQWDLVMTSTLLAMLPIIILYLFAQKYIIRGMVEGAVK